MLGNKEQIISMFLLLMHLPALLFIFSALLCTWPKLTFVYYRERDIHSIRWCQILPLRGCSCVMVNTSGIKYHPFLLAIETMKSPLRLRSSMHKKTYIYERFWDHVHIIFMTFLYSMKFSFSFFFSLLSLKAHVAWVI